MSLPISITPTLTGKDAIRFAARARKAETEPVSPQTIEDYKRAKKIYEEVCSDPNSIL